MCVPLKRKQRTRMNYSGIWKRIIAGLVDILLINIVAIIIYLILVATINLSDPVRLVASLIIPWMYWSVMESSPKQATLGKMVLGLIVTDLEGNRISFGRATGRYFGRFISISILFVGYILIGFTDRKQALHDMMAGCLVVNSGKWGVRLGR